jgi:transcriptional regulator with XRE-family HTH domain
MTQTELAAEFGKSESAVRMWELGKSKPDADTLIDLTKLFNCTADYLLGLAEHRNEMELDEMLEGYKYTSDMLSEMEIPHRNRFFSIIEAAERCYNLLHRTESHTLSTAYIEFLHSTFSNLLALCFDCVRTEEFLKSIKSLDNPDDSIPIYFGKTLDIQNYYVMLIAKHLRGFTDSLADFSVSKYHEILGSTGEKLSREDMEKAYHEYLERKRAKNGGLAYSEPTDKEFQDYLDF